MLLSSQTPHLYSYFTLVFSIFCFITCLYHTKKWKSSSKVTRTTGIRIIQRLMGIILMVIAVQFIINGGLSIYISQIIH